MTPVDDFTVWVGQEPGQGPLGPLRRGVPAGASVLSQAPGPWQNPAPRGGKTKICVLFLAVSEGHSRPAHVAPPV